MAFPFLSCRRILSFDYIRPAVRTEYTFRGKNAILDKAYIKQKLGLPACPKRPTTPYLRYSKEMLPLVAAKHPNVKLMEQSKIIGKMWNALDAAEKDKYFQASVNDGIVYRQQMIEYKKTITPDDKRKLHAKEKEIREEVQKRKHATEQQKLAMALGRPVRPLGGYMKFFMTHRDRKPDESYKDFIRRKTSEWKSLSESQRAAYKAPAEDVEKYREDYLAWKGRMIISGNNAFRPRASVDFEDILKSEKS